MQPNSIYIALSIALAMNLSANAHAADKPRTIGSVERLDPALDKLVPADAKMEVVGEGFAWCEGPVWISSPPPSRGGARGGGFLLFSDIPNNAIMRWDAKSGVTQYLKPAGYTGEGPRGG